MSNASDEHADKNTAKTLKEDEVESAKAQMRRVREENAKLKMLLEQIESDYKSLRMRFYDIVRQESNKISSNNTSAQGINNEDIDDEHELVSLRLGRISPIESKKEDTITSSSSKTTREDEHSEGGLKLGLESCSFQNSKTDDVEMKNYSSPGNSFNGTKGDEAGETWPPSKVLKTTRTGGDDELSQPTVKRARVSVRARCDAPTLHDGCQWRKYGQKIAKGNPCPRAYYRCTVGPSCPVRKQVQRCAEDTSILITTYEGTHNHPLPVSATAMASTTSAAASMLLSGSSSTSQSGFGSSPTTPAINLGGLNVNLFDNSKTRPFYLPNSSVPQLPTITLDLASSPSTSTQFNIFSSGLQSSSPRFPSTSVNFSSPESSMLPSVWSNGLLDYARLPYPNTAADSSSAFSKQSQELYYHPYMEKNSQAASQQALAETLTKAITSDPSIQSVIAAAISTMVAGGPNQAAIDSRGENVGQNIKWAEQVQVVNSSFLASNGKGCASSFLNQSTSLNSQPGSLRMQQPPLAFSIANSTSRSTVDNRDQTN